MEKKKNKIRKTLKNDPFDAEIGVAISVDEPLKIWKRKKSQAHYRGSNSTWPRSKDFHESRRIHRKELWTIPRIYTSCYSRERKHFWWSPQLLLRTPPALDGPYSAVSTPILSPRSSLWSNFQDLQDLYSFAPLESRHESKNLSLFRQRFCWTCRKILHLLGQIRPFSNQIWWTFFKFRGYTQDYHESKQDRLSRKFEKIPNFANSKILKLPLVITLWGYQNRPEIWTTVVNQILKFAVGNW